MKKYKVVGLPKMHNGGVGPGHPHGESFSIRNLPNPIKTNPITGEIIEETPSERQEREKNQAIAERKERQRLKKQKRQQKRNQEYYDADTKDINTTVDDLTFNGYYNPEQVVDEINNPIQGVNDQEIIGNASYHGDKHSKSVRSIIGSLDRIEADYVQNQYSKKSDGSGNFYKTRDSQGSYDREVDDLRKRYNAIEAKMELAFGDRKGDPTRAKDWMNRDGRIYRKQLRALESDIQNLYLRRLDQYGTNPTKVYTGYTEQYDYVDNTDPENKIYDDETGEWTGEYKKNEILKVDKKGKPILKRYVTNMFKRRPLDPNDEGDAKFIKEQIAEYGYLPKPYRLEQPSVTRYVDSKDQNLQEKLSDKAEQLFLNAVDEGYVPKSELTIGGDIDELKAFIKNEKKSLKDFKKAKKGSNKLKAEYADYIGVENFNADKDFLATEENYKLLRQKISENPSDRYLIKIYEDYFRDFDPNNVKLTKEEQTELIDQGWGDGSMDAVKQAALAAAYAPAAVEAGFAFFNPTIQAALTPYFFYEAVKEDGILEQAADEFSKEEYWDGTVDAGFGLLDVFAFKGLLKTLKAPGAATRFFSKLKSRNLPKGYLEKINNSLPPMLQLDNIDDVPRNLNLPSATNKVPKSFESEIDWAKWNKDIPNNKPLMEEYRAIEYNTKQDGTWMKNADGTPFEGRKENFVQEQSENFKKAFPEGADVVYRGVSKNRPVSKEGIFTAENRELAESYAPYHNKMTLGPDVPESTGGIQELYFPKQPRSADIDLRRQEWTEIDLNNIQSDKDWKRFLEINIKGQEDQVALREKQMKALRKKIREEGLAHDVKDENGWTLRELADSIKASNAKARYWKEQQNMPTPEVNEVVEQLRKAFPDETSTDDILKYMLENDIGSVKLRNIHDDGFGTEVLINNKPEPGRNVKSRFGNDGMFDMTNPNIYKSVLPLVGAAGAAAAAAGDEDSDTSMMAALPLMIFGRGKKVNLKNVYKNIANWFKTVPALKNVPFKQSELQSSVLKNLPAKFKKEFGPNVTFEQLAEKQPEMLKNLIVEHVVDRYTYYKGDPTVRRVTERELPIFYAEQEEAAQFALDFNTAWMEGSLDPRSKELIKPVIDGIREARKLEEEIVSYKPLYDDAIKEVRDGIQNDWNRKVIFPGSMGPMSDAVPKEEAIKIGKDLLKVYKDAAAKVVGTENHGNYDTLIKDLEGDIAYIAQMGTDNFRKLSKHHDESVYSFTESQAEDFLNGNSDMVYDYYDLVDRKNAAYDKIKDQIDAIGPVENVLAPDIAERVKGLRGNVQDILDTSKAVTLDARGGVNKESVDGDIISGLVEGRYSESDLKGTVGESMKGDYQGFAGIKSRTNKGNIGQITKRGLPANSENLDELYTMYEKGFLDDKLKGLIVRQEDILRQPIDVAGTMAHEDKHIYQALIGYLDPHVESQIYGYSVADQKSDLGKAIQEVLVEPKKVDDPTANIDAGDTYTDETYQASPIEADANLQKERVKYAYEKFQEIMNTDNPVSKFRKLKESAGSDARYQKAVIEEIVRVMKIPENKAQFIEDLMSSPVGNAVNKHFKIKYRGAIDPLTDDTKTMAGKAAARQFLEMLPALLIGAGLTTEFANSESYEKGGQIKRKLKRSNAEFEELELTKKEALAYAQKGYIVEEID